MESRDSDFLAELGISGQRPRLPESAFESKTAQGSLANEAPISIYSTRMSEGTFPLSSTQGRNPFSKTTAFTNDIGEPTKARPLPLATFSCF